MSTMDWVLHVDLDQFIAAVEIARKPALRGRPVIVGGAGDPMARGVVATASYEAREYGVHSGMPLRTAFKRCPEGIYLAADNAAYLDVSQQVMAALREVTELVEVLGWDEAFLGVRTADPESVAIDIQHAVGAATGMSCSVGIGDNKLRAKLATGFAKPAGIYRLTRENWVAVMADLAPDALWGIGSKTARKLAGIDVRTVADLARSDPAELARRFGPRMGPWYQRLALGAGDTDVIATPRETRSRSRETTFQENLTEPSALDRAISDLARRVSRDVATEERPAVRIAVKVRFAPFHTHTHSVTLPRPTFDPAEIERVARELLARFELGRPVRLLGVRAEFTSPNSSG